MRFRNLCAAVAFACLMVPGVSLAQTELVNGIPETGLQGADGSLQTFYLDVPAGTTSLGFRLTQGAGGAYMTVNYGEPYADAPPGTAECADATGCEFANPDAGLWYVEIFGLSAYSGAELRGWSLTRLQNGDTVAGLAGDIDTYRWFYVHLPGGVDSLAATTSGGTGNASLGLVSAASWDAILNGSGGTLCESELAGNAESCTRDHPQAGDWLVFLRGETAYSGVTLTVDYEGGDSGGALTPLDLGALLLLAALGLARRRRVGFAAAALLLGSAPASAADATAAPPTIADFVRFSDFQSAKLSPNGELLATTRMLKDRKVLQILRVKDLQPIGAYGLKGDRDIEDLYWPNDEYVLFGASRRLGTLDKVTLTHELMQVRIDGTSPMTLIAPDRTNSMVTEFNSRHFDIVDLLRDDPDNILYSTLDNDGEFELPNLYRLNLRTGRKVRVMQSLLRYGGFFSDVHRGVVRTMYGSTKDGSYVVMARKSEDAAWLEIGRTPLAEGGLNIVGYARDPNQVYITDGVEGGVAGLYALDLTTKARALLHTNQEYELSGLIYGRDLDSPIGVEWEGERAEWKFFDDNNADAAFLKALRKGLGDVDLEFTSFSKDRTLAVVAAGGDRVPTNYFVVDLARHSVVARLPTRPWIDPGQMSPMQPVQFKARDGQLIHGYLTLPRMRAEGPVPMVVYPHGGPHYVRDAWGFDDDVQLLASRGYAVLQPNYRGSGGYGMKFQKAGYGQWGKAMEDDVIDATKWAIQQGYADPGRICIYGASYGAYAALEAVSVEPDLYRCAIGYAGVYDLAALRSKDLDEVSIKYWKKVIGNDASEDAAHSPSRHAQRIKAPVFLVHGEEDQVTPLAQFKLMRDALKGAGKTYETLVKPNEGHGFYDEKNNEEFYTRMLAFLDKHTAPKPK